MFCPSCGDDSTANFCPACGSHVGGAEEPKSGGGGSSIGVGGTIVLLLLLVVGSFFVISSRPKLPAWMRLPRWLSATESAAPATAVPPVVVIPTTSIPFVPREPYEELSSTKVELNGYSEQELRIRLRVDTEIMDVEPLVLSRMKDLRRSADVVRVTVYPAGSDGTASDAPAAAYLAADLEKTPLAEAEAPGTTVVEPGIFRLAR